MTIKKIGEANTMSPVDIYDRIKTIAAYPISTP